MLQVKRLFHRYSNNRNYTLKNISFDLAKGKILSILGETGCGKTTLLNTIAGFQAIEKGNIFIDDEIVKGPNEVLIPGNKNIALLAQDFRFMPQHTVFENLEYFVRKSEKKFIKIRCSNLLRHFDLLQYRNKKPNQLSGGQQQKLAMAIALSTQPKVLLLDEPFSHLDIVQSELLKEEINRAVSTFEISVIIVTHNIRDALSMSDEIIVMQKGQILQKDKPNLIYERPINEKVAKLTGTTNIVDLAFLKKVLDKTNVKQLQDFGKQTFCIRPENITLKKGKGSIVEHINYQGSNQMIKFRYFDKIIFALSTNFKVKLGDEFQISIKTQHCQPLN